MKELHYVYLLFRPWNNTPAYVGKGSGNRVHQHAATAARGNIFKNKHLGYIFAKAKRLGMEVPFLLLYKGAGAKEALCKEVFFIAKYGRKDLGKGTLVNHTDGGDGLVNPSKEVRDKIAKTLTGRTQSKETCNKRRLALMGNSNAKGAVQSNARRASTSARMRGNTYASVPHTEEWKAEHSAKMMGNSHGKGVKYSEEVVARRKATAAKNAAAKRAAGIPHHLKGKKQTAEHKAKAAAARAKGRIERSK